MLLEGPNKMWNNQKKKKVNHEELQIYTMCNKLVIIFKQLLLRILDFETHIYFKHVC